MSKSQINILAFKPSPIGNIPADWSISRGDQVTNLIGKGSSPKWQGFDYCESGMIFITSENVRDGYLDISKPKYLPLAFHEKLQRTKLEKGDILINLVGASIGRSCLIREELPPSNVNQAVAVLRSLETIHNEYVSYYFQAPHTIDRIFSIQVDAARPNISLSDLRSFPIPLPPLPEQEKIAEVLGTWDRAIETQQNLIDSLTRRKQALTQQLLTGKTRLPGFEESSLVDTRWGQRPQAWNLCKIGDIAKQSSLKNKDNKVIPVLSCTKHHGLVDSLSYFKKRVFSDDLTPYRVVNRGDFAYATNHIEEGSIGYQDIHDAGLVSPMYTVFRTDKSVSADFLFPLLKTELYIHIYQAMTSASVDRRGSLRWNEFSKIPVAIPPLDEQKAIAKVLTAANKEIQLHTQHRTTLRTQKRGLMQQLLTGKTRVAV